LISINPCTFPQKNIEKKKKKKKNLQVKKSDFNLSEMTDEKAPVLDIEQMHAQEHES
jgi:hypothetical protein